MQCQHKTKFLLKILTLFKGTCNVINLLDVNSMAWGLEYQSSYNAGDTEWDDQTISNQLLN